MLKLLSEGEGEIISSISGQSVFGCKIGALACAYGMGKGFAMFWSDSETKAVIAKMDDQVILSGNMGNADEYKLFFDCLGVREILCSTENAKKIGLKASRSGEIMSLKKGRVPAGVTEYEVTAEKSPNIRGIYELLVESGTELSFEAFYLDLSHRVRHGAAQVYTCSEESRLLGVSIALNAENSVLLSAVTVLPEYRGRGIGSALVGEVVSRCAEKPMFLQRAHNENNAFYTRLGFENTGKWAEIITE